MSIFVGKDDLLFHTSGTPGLCSIGKEVAMSPRVLFTASNYSHILNFHRPYLAAFRSLGWTVHVGCGGNASTVPEADCVFELPFVKEIYAASNFQAMWILRRIIEQNHYELICTHTSLAAFFTRVGGMRVSPPPRIVSVVHGYLFGERPMGARDSLLLIAEKLTARRTDLLLTMNEADFLSATNHRLCRRIVKIQGMGVDFSRQDQVTAAKAQKIRTALQRTDNDVLLLCAAEFSSRKNQGMLLRALQRLPARFRLILPGQGQLMEHCHTLARELGVADRTEFPGQVADLPLWYAAVDVAVSASRSEGLPFGVMEAMYAGLPVVASKIKGHTDLIDDEQSGLLYPCDDIESFIAQILRLTNNPGLADQIGAAARDAVAPYALEKVLPDVMELYLSAAAVEARDTNRSEGSIAERRET